MFYRLVSLTLRNYKRSINSRDKEKGNTDLICEAAKYLAALYHLLIILSAVQKLFGVKDSQIFFLNLLVCLRHQDYKMNMQTLV